MFSHHMVRIILAFAVLLLLLLALMARPENAMRDLPGYASSDRPLTKSERQILDLGTNALPALAGGQRTSNTDPVVEKNRYELNKMFNASISHED